MLITYDVNTETAQGRRRLRRVAKLCEGYGQRVQKSVFECTLTDVNYERMKQRLVSTINAKQDSLRIYRLPEHSPKTLEAFGVSNVVDFKEPLVV